MLDEIAREVAEKLPAEELNIYLGSREGATGGRFMEAAKMKSQLEERIKALEAEKSELSAEVEALKSVSELAVKASALESEVARLRDDKKALEEKAAAAGVSTASEEKSAG
jgi:predicted membrane chloride channel (bestrophin family)